VAGTQRHHVALVEACRTRDGNQAAESTREALEMSLSQITERLDQLGTLDQPVVGGSPLAQSFIPVDRRHGGIEA